MFPGVLRLLDPHCICHQLCYLYNLKNIITCICIVQLQSQIPKFPIQNNDICVQYLQQVIRKEKPPLPMLM